MNYVSQPPESAAEIAQLGVEVQRVRRAWKEEAVISLGNLGLAGFQIYKLSEGSGGFLRGMAILTSGVIAGYYGSKSLYDVGNANFLQGQLQAAEPATEGEPQPGI